MPGSPTIPFLANAVESSTGIIVFSLDNRYRYTSFSKSHHTTMKMIWNADIHVGDCMLDFLSEKDAEKAKNNFDRALRGEHFILVEEYGDENLQRSFWENRYDPIFDADGKVIGLVVFVSDVSSYIALSKHLEKTKTRLDLALESGNIGVWEINLKTQGVFLSDNIHEMIGSEKTAAHSLDSQMRFVYEEDREEAMRIFNNAVVEKIEFTNEYRVVKKDGIGWVNVRGKVITNQQGEAVSVVGTLQDITQRKQIEQDILQKNAELLKINQELDRFVYSTSHDLRAPIASLLGLVNIARLETSEEKWRELLDLKEKSLKKLDAFIRDIINYSRNTRLQNECALVDIEQIVNDVYTQFGFMPHSDRIRKTVSVVAPLPFHSDRSRLQMVLNNLISNSIKYADLSKQDPFIEVTAHIDNVKATIVIKDNGEGIAAQHKEKVFDMFYRASEKSQGSGLGLYIVKEALEKLGGAISIQSEQGVGTEVTLQVPNRA